MAVTRDRCHALLLTCEHASARLPRAVGSLGLDRRLLASHVGWDRGARALAAALATTLDVELIAGRYSRLLVDLNRSAHNPRVIAAEAWGHPIPGNEGLTVAQRAARLDRYWRPYREFVERAVGTRIAQCGICIHLAVHTFDPDIEAARRRCDVGLLYDPARPLERRLAAGLQQLLVGSSLRVRKNYPYRGVSDGLTRALRRRFPGSRYAGLEIEWSQAWLSPGGRPAAAARLLAEAVVSALGSMGERCGNCASARGKARKRKRKTVK